MVYASILSTMPNLEIGICDKSYLLLKLDRRLFNAASTVSDVKKLTELNTHSAHVKTPLHEDFPMIKTILVKRR